MKLAIHGAAGRMGLSLVRVIAEDPEATLVAAVDREGSPSLGRDVGELAGIAAAVAAPASVESDPAIAPIPREGELPLSFAQRRIWFLDQLGVGAAYNTPSAFRNCFQILRRVRRVS